MYWSEHPYVLSHLVLLFVIKNFLFCNSSIISLLYAAAVAESSFLSSDEKEQNTACSDTASDVIDELE